MGTHGGAQRLVIEDIKNFVSLGWDVHLVTQNYSKGVGNEYGMPDQVTVHTYNIDRFENIGVARISQKAHIFRSLFDKLDPDIVFSHYNNKSVYLSIKSLIHFDPIFLAHVHGSIFWFKNRILRIAHTTKECYNNIVNQVPGHLEFWEEPDASLPLRLHTMVMEQIEKLALNKCDATFVNTNQVQKELDCLYSVDSRICRPGVSASWINDRAPENKNLTDKQNTILSISRLDSRKRISLLLRAFSKVIKTHDNLGLVIGGKGPQRDHLESLANQLDVEDRIKFTGYIPEYELRSYYKSADVFAVPGWMSYGITPLEAYSMGTKVALSHDAFAKEILASQPGVEVLNPEVDQWVSGLHSLLNKNPEMNSACVPTWEEHHSKKQAVIESIQS